MTDTAIGSGEPPIELLGQKVPYPRTVFGLLAVIAVCVTICLSLYVAGTARPENVAAIVSLWTPRIGDEPIEDTFLLQFWTPSALTKEAFAGSSDDAWKWQDCSEVDAKAFGDKLHENKSVVGYRRWEVFGHGTSTPKHGYWWVLTVREEFTIPDLEKAYREHWGMPEEKQLYIETVRREAKYVGT